MILVRLGLYMSFNMTTKYYVQQLRLFAFVGRLSNIEFSPFPAALPTNSFRFKLRFGKAAFTIQPYKSATQVKLLSAIVPGP
jgi:hypothetical protein